MIDLIGLYKKILLIRIFENKLNKLFEKGLIHGTAHLCVGQEFIPAIISNYLKKEDIVTSTHRGHGHALSKGLDLKTFLAELLGKKEGYNSGKGGTQHTLSKEFNFYVNGVTGGMLPVANGMAFANKYKKNQNIVIAYLGDGGFNEGYVLESINLASVFKLPILFVCENNLYAMSTPIKKSHSGEIYKRARSFNITSELVEDNDYKKLDDVAKKFIEEVRALSEPRFIEIRTYRHYGHSKNDLNLYREKSEEDYWYERDVLKKIENELIDSEKITSNELNQIKEENRDYIDKIADEVIALPEPEPSEVTNYVYLD